MLAAEALGGSVQARWALRWLAGWPAGWLVGGSRAVCCAALPCQQAAPLVALPPHRQLLSCPLVRAQVKGQLLRELLVESKAYGYLLGSGGAGALPCLHACIGMRA